MIKDILRLHYVGILGVDLDFRLTKILLAELLWVPAWLWLFPTGEDGNLRQYLESSNEKFQKRCILSKLSLLITSKLFVTIWCKLHSYILNDEV